MPDVPAGTDRKWSAQQMKAALAEAGVETRMAVGKHSEYYMLRACSGLGSFYRIYLVYEPTADYPYRIRSCVSHRGGRKIGQWKIPQKAVAAMVHACTDYSQMHVLK